MPSPSTPPPAPRLWRIEHCGAVTSVGTRAWQSAASWVGMQKRFRKTLQPRIAARPFTTAPCPEVTGGLDGIPRLARLLAAALADLSEALPGARDASHAVPVPEPDRLVLALPLRIEGEACAEVWRQALAELARWAGPQVAAAWVARPCHFVRGGHSAGFAALEALGKLGEHQGTALLMAVDSLLDESSLAQAHARGALLAEATPDGCVASEAAACLWLTAVSDTRASHARGLVLHAPALAGNATAHRRPPQDPDAAALEEVLRTALAQAGWEGDNVGFSLSDFDGSSWRALAQVAARVRAARYLDPTDWEPAAVIGQVGAATGPVHWALAAQRVLHDLHPANSILSWTLDEGTEAAAVALERTLQHPRAHTAQGHAAEAGSHPEQVRTYSARFLQNNQNIDR
ncbi:hypothetical protein [Paracidovorax konjaci]|uniref:3-oxoacyl-[acyl-carrier-protein] synthase-1 n=1 Tax=Paracidovorax konjaci TaxID=32040 RepID=A0A1I1SLI0_9BURK|nr:hypothetical protein [Paracidovorax konjaci]SFD47306.1 3-oxoacyl-[acyl-carrier-protein] synthase-1 [Paracidovorax konjaci]